MRFTKGAIALAFIILISAGSLQAKEWRGLVPKHSTCEDAKRILGIDKCQTSYYDLKDERIHIFFAESNCDSHPTGKWNVPIGTVLEITVYPKVKQRLSDLGVDLSKYTKERDLVEADWFNYWNREDGFYFTVGPDEKVLELTYFGASKDNYLRCPNSKPLAPPKTKSH